jgi:hypothetical protein
MKPPIQTTGSSRPVTTLVPDQQPKMSVQQLEQALAGLLTPNNVVIKQSRQFLFQMLKTPNSIVGLMNRVDATQNPNTGTRQVSAVLLRKVINKHWGRLDNATREQVQTRLLHLLTQEPEILVRRALGAVIARLSKHLLPGWTNMLQLIQACAGQNDPRYREQAYLLLYQSAEPIGRTLESQFAGLCQLYGKGLQDADPRVRIMALKAASCIVSYVSRTNHVMHFQSLIPVMYQMVRQAAVELQEETAVSLGLECFVDLALSQAPILKGKRYTTQAFVKNNPSAAVEFTLFFSSFLLFFFCSSILLFFCSLFDRCYCSHACTVHRPRGSFGQICVGIRDQS